MFKCKECGHTTITWQGKCSECQEWNTMVETTDDTKNKKIKKTSTIISEEDQQNDIKGYKILDYINNTENTIEYDRVISNDTTFNNFFGGGLVKGSVNLVSGSPGVGKSTFLLYIAKYFPNKNIAYVSGEESEMQILGRAKRMQQNDTDFNNVTIYNQKLLENIENIIDENDIDIIIIDSLQMLETNTIDGELGGLKQQKHIGRKLVKNIKTRGIISFLVGHVNSSDEIAGAHFIEHLVDSVIKIEPATERGDSLKIMKNLKNRFSGSDLMIYELYHDKIEIIDQSKLLDLFIEETAIGEKGTVLSAVTMSGGHQVFLIEIQSLVTEQEFNYPEKIISGFGKEQLKTLIKIIGENLDSDVYKKDIAINIFSPLKYNGIEISLGILISIICYIRGLNTGKKVFLGQVGFNGELKSVPRQRDIINKLKSFGIKSEDIISTEKYKNIKDILTMIIKQNK